MSTEGEASIPVDRLIEVYRKIRDAVDTAEAAHKTLIEDLKSKMDAVAAKLLDICNTQGVDSLKTATGTAIRSTRTRYWTSDWERMYAFIKEHDAPFLLEQRIHAGNMTAYLNDNPEQTPQGLNADTKYVITVRKPTNR